MIIRLWLLFNWGFWQLLDVNRESSCSVEGFYKHSRSVKGCCGLIRIPVAKITDFTAVKKTFHLQIPLCQCGPQETHACLLVLEKLSRPHSMPIFFQSLISLSLFRQLTHKKTTPLNTTHIVLYVLSLFVIHIHKLTVPRALLLF